MSTFPSLRAKKGFTLIELLVVIAIIGVLTALSTFGFQGAREASRNTQRKSDISQYKDALEVLANSNNGLYPQYTTAGGVIAPTTLCTAISQTNCINDPLYTSDNTYAYRYQSVTSTGAAGSITATRYVLWAKLESTSSTTEYFVMCSNGKVGVVTAGIPPATAGTCPASL